METKKLDSSIHRWETKQISNINYVKLDDVIKILLEAKSEILEKYPEAFDLEVVVDLDDKLGDSTNISFVRNMTSSEKARILKSKEMVEKFREQEERNLYLKLKEKYGKEYEWS